MYGIYSQRLLNLEAGAGKSLTARVQSRNRNAIDTARQLFDFLLDFKTIFDPLFIYLDNCESQPSNAMFKILCH